MWIRDGKCFRICSSRGGIAALPFGKEKLYVLGGHDLNGYQNDYLDSVECLNLQDVGAGWKVLQDMSVANNNK